MRPILPRGHTVTLRQDWTALERSKRDEAHREGPTPSSYPAKPLLPGDAAVRAADPLAAHHPALDHEAGGLAPGRHDLKAGVPREAAELLDGPLATADQQHLDLEAVPGHVGRDAAEHGDAPIRVCRLGATAQDAARLGVGPVVEHLLEQVEVGAGGQRVEE